MHALCRMNRRRLLFATVGSKALSLHSKPQLGAHSKWQQAAAINGISWMHSSLVAWTHCFCRSFSADSIEASEDGISDSKLRRILSVCEGKSWNADIEGALGEYSKMLVNTLIHEVLHKMEPGSTKDFIRWARKQEGYECSTNSMNVLLRKFLHAGNFETALEVVEEMKENNVAIDGNSFTTLAFFYVKAGMMAEAEETVNLVKSFGYSPKARLYRYLFDGYLQAGDEEGAARVQQSFLRLKDMNYVLLEYARAGKAELVLKMLEIMEKNDRLPTVPTCILVMKSLCSGRMTEQALKFLENISEKVIFSDDEVYNTLISHLFEANRVDEALKLVSHIKDNPCQPNIKTNNIVIQGYLNSGQTEKAHLHLETMLLEGCMPTRETLKLFDTTNGKAEKLKEDMLQLPDESPEIVGGVSQEFSKDEKQYSRCKSLLEICEGKPWDTDTEEALSGYSKELTPGLVCKLLQNMESDVAKRFFVWAAKQTGYRHSKRLYSELFQNLSQAGKLDSAIKVLKEMANYMIIDFNAFTPLIHHYGKAGMMTEAEEAVELMRSFGLEPDAKLYSALLNGYLQVSDYESAAKLVQSFSDVKEFNAAISAFASANKPDSALKVLELMEKSSCPANVQTYYLLVKCLCTANMSDEALTALENMQEKGLAPEVKVYNTLISYFCQRKRVDEASRLVTKMKTAGCQPDILTHTSLINGYLTLRKVEAAYQYVEEMKAEGCMPTDEISRLFIAKLSAQDVEKAAQEFKTAAESNHKLWPDACNSLLKWLIKEGKLDEALEVFERMKDAGSVDPSSYGVMLRGCCNFFRFDVMNRLLTDVRNKNLQLPMNTYVVLLQTYSHLKKFKEVVALFEELQKSGRNFGARTATAVLDALSRAHQLDLGVNFCKNIAKSSIQVNEQQLKHFFRLLARMGRAGEADELMKGLSENGCIVLKKSGGQIMA